jgi:prepilin-type N-terminal cleavage/methylation domain-containing protein
MRATPRPARPSGYTIIEMLVVVAIILVLLAIIVPSLQRSRDVSRRLVGQANIRSLTQYVLAYAGRHDSKLPNLTKGALQPNHLLLAERDELVNVHQAPREFFFSPTNSDLGSDDNLWNGVTYPGYAFIGYSYWAGNPLLSGPSSPAVDYTGVDESTLKRSVMPMGIDKVSLNKILWSDLTLRVNGAYVVAGQSTLNHYSGSPSKPIAGASIGFIDTHVEFHYQNEVDLRVSITDGLGGLFEHFW